MSGDEQPARPETVPVTIAVPTIGRPEQVAECLASVAACRPAADEILIVDQSADHRVMAEVVERFAAAGARLVECPGRGRSVGANLALTEARNDVVLFTDDDCVADPSWVGAAWRHMAEDPGGMVTGKVLPGGDPEAVPSTIAHDDPHDFTGELRYGALFAGNMVCRASVLLEFGAFEERMKLAAADNELCYRWLRAGRRLRYEPDLVVWHNDWRTPEQLERLYVRYARGQGMLYAKHLRAGDLRMLRFLARDVRLGLRGGLAGLVRRDRRWADWRQGILRGLPTGLREGWRLFAP